MPSVPRRPPASLRARLGDAVDYLEARLTEKVDLDEVSRRCGLSRWYFMRVFQLAAGLSVGEYMRMRRLSRAAEELAAGRPILETAKAWGYGSQAAFTRTFSRTFGVPPVSYARAVRAGGAQVALLVPFEPRLPPEIEQVPPPIVEHRQPLRLVGQRMQTPVFGHQAASAIGDFWVDWVRWQRWRPLGIPGEPTLLGLSKLRVDGELEYLIGVVAGPETPVPEGYVEAHVQGGPHALFSASGPPAVMSRALLFAAYGKNALERGRARRHGGWDISTIEASPEHPPGAMRCRLWVPLRERPPSGG